MTIATITPVPTGPSPIELASLGERRVSTRSATIVAATCATQRMSVKRSYFDARASSTALK